MHGEINFCERLRPGSTLCAKVQTKSHATRYNAKLLDTRYPYDRTSPKLLHALWVHYYVALTHT